MYLPNGQLGSYPTYLAMTQGAGQTYQPSTGPYSSYPSYLAGAQSYAQQAADAQTAAARGWITPNPTIQVTNPGMWNTQTTPARAFSPTELQALYAKVLRGDETLQGQGLQALAGQEGSWQGNFVNPVAAAAFQYGGALPQSIIDQLKGIPAATWTDPVTGKQTSLGANVWDTISGQQQAAAANPYSQVAQIGHQLHLANNQADANLAARGMYNSSDASGLFGENAYQAGLARYNAATNLGNTISGAYSNFLGGMNTATQQMGQNVSDALGRATNAINLGVYGTPYHPAVTTKSFTPSTQLQTAVSSSPNSLRTMAAPR
jgi:hypothetical protein